jgi:hypothetical protein
VEKTHERNWKPNEVRSFSILARMHDQPTAMALYFIKTSAPCRLATGSVFITFFFSKR